MSKNTVPGIGLCARRGTHLRRTGRILSAGLVLSLLISGNVLAATRASRFDPADFTSLGTLELSSGTITFDTAALTATGFPNGVVGKSESGGTEVAVFTFDNISLSGTATVVIVGTRPVALLSKGSISIGVPLRVDGASSTSSSGGSGGAGGYGGGSSNANGNGPGAGRYSSSNAGSGAGHGGAGGQGADSTAGGPAYGDAPLTEIKGGSGGGGGSGVVAGGGGGGGAIELSASVSINIAPGGVVSATGGHGFTVSASSQYPGGGGSGGAVLLNAPTIVNLGSVLAKGGNGGNSPAGGAYDGGGGGGGGRVAVFADAFTPGTISVVGGAAGTADNPGQPGGAGTIHQYTPTPPVATNVTATGLTNTALELVFSATDDGLPNPPAALTYIVVSLPVNGTLEEAGVGPITAVPYSLSGGGRKVTYTPAAGFAGSDNFTYKANDGGVPPGGGDSNVATVSVTVVDCSIPPAPSTPVPADGATDVALDVELAWSGSAGGCATSYDVYFGTDNPPTTLRCDNTTGLTCKPGALARSTTYYWQVVATNLAGTTSGPVWSFTTEPCPLPPTPDNPGPADGAVNVDLNADLGWSDLASGLETSEEAAPVIDPDLEWWKTEVPKDFCATEERYLARAMQAGMTLDAALCATQGVCDAPAERDLHVPDASTPIKTYRLSIHVFCEDNGLNCAATQASVDAQMVTVNENYLPWRIQFVYDTDFINSTLYRYWTSSEESGMKSAYADKPTEKINVFVVSNSGSYSVATFPWDPDALTYMGGIVMHQPMFGPGITTLTHEIGHCIGLWHTHHGVSEVSGCVNCHEFAGGTDRDTTGDFCSQTDPTPTNYSCAPPGGSDTCNGVAWGNTDYHNYMGYAPASCRTEFESQQAGRFHCWTEQVLTGWLVPGAPDCPVTYDVYFDTVNPPVNKVASDLTVRGFDPGLLDLATTYYWKVVAKNGRGTVEGPVWTFSTRLCPPAAPPGNPSPANGAMNVPVDTSLGWGTLGSCTEENFDDGVAQNWTEDVDTDWNVVGQQYVASNSVSDQSMVSTYSGQEWSDVNFEVKLRPSSSATHAHYMLVRATPNFEAAPTYVGSGYGFGIGTTGYYYVFKLVGGAFTILQSWTATPYLNPGTNWNTLSVQAVGSSLQFFINGSLVWSRTDTSISSGRVGLLGFSGEGSHYFDDVKVCPPTAASPAEIDSLQAWYNEHSTGGDDPAGANDEPAPIPPEGLTPGKAVSSLPCDLTYDVYLGTSNPPTTRIAADLLAPPCQPPAALAKGTTYYWRVVAKDAGGPTEGPVWSFTTVFDCPAPPPPSAPLPADNGTGVPVTTDLRWGGTLLVAQETATPLQAPDPGEIDLTTGLPFTSNPAPLPARADLALANKKVLWDTTHGVYMNLGPSGDFTQLVSRLASMSMTVETTSAGVNTVNLSAYHVVVACLGSNWYSPYTSAEITALRNFVAAGGGLLIMAENNTCPNAMINPLASSFGVQCGGSTALFTLNDLTAHAIFTGCTQVILVGGGNLTLTSPAFSLARASGATGIAAYSPPGQRVVVIGDTTLFTNGSNFTNTATFATSLFTWLGEIGAGACGTTYDVYLDTVNPPAVKIASDLTAPPCQPTTVLANGTTYYWKVVAKTTGGETSGPVWQFKTVAACAAPPAPADPDPAAGAVDVPVDAALNWTAGSASLGAPRTAEELGQLAAQSEANGQDENGGADRPTVGPYSAEAIESAAAGTVQILAFKGHSDNTAAGEYENTLNAIRQHFTDFNVTPTLTEAAATLATELVGKDVFLVPEQETWNAVAMSAWGTSIAPVLQAFVNGGGVVILADDGDKVNVATFVANTGLMTAGNPTTPYYNSRTCPVAMPGHAIMNGMPSTFSIMNGNTTFSGATNGSVLATYNSTPVVIARQVGAGGIVLMGFDFYQYNSDMGRVIANAVQWATHGPSCATVYDVYLDTVNPPAAKVCSDLTAPPCQPPASLAEATTYFWKVVAKSDGGQAESPVWSFTTQFDFNYKVVVLDAPSGSGASAPPTSLGDVSETAPFYVELWARDEGPLNTGLSCVFADLAYPPDTLEVMEIIAVPPFDVIGSNGTNSPGKVDEWGGCTFNQGVGVEPAWACVGRLKMKVKPAPCTAAGGCASAATFTLQPASGESSAYGRGTVPVDKIRFGTTGVNVHRYCLYDLSHDCLVSAPDVGLFAPSWLSCDGQSTYKAEADFDCSGCVAGGDIGWFATAWLKACGATGVVYPPCRCSGLPAGEASATGKVQLTYRVRRQLLEAETLADLPTTAAVRLQAGETCFVEVWARDLALGTQGLAAVVSDVAIKSERLTPVEIVPGSGFGLLASGTLQPTGVSALGGATLDAGAAAGKWTRVAAVRLLAGGEVGVSAATLGLAPGSVDPVGRIGAGSVPLTSIQVCPNVGADRDGDCDVDAQDAADFISCASGPGIPQLMADCGTVDFDSDGDVDQTDFGRFQRCLAGPDQQIDPACSQE